MTLVDEGLADRPDALALGKTVDQDLKSLRQLRGVAGMNARAVLPLLQGF